MRQHHPHRRFHEGLAWRKRFLSQARMPEAGAAAERYEDQELRESAAYHVRYLTGALELRAQTRNQRSDCFHSGLPIHQSVHSALAPPARQLQALVRAHGQ